MRDHFLTNTLLLLILIPSVGSVAAQELPPTLKPNYCKIARLTAQPASPYFLDTLAARFMRCDTTLTVDDLRCLYYGGDEYTLHALHNRYTLLQSRFGRNNASVNQAWWRLQMMLTAVWSSGDGSRRKPLHVRTRNDAAVAALGFDTTLWFKVKGQRRFSVAPPQ